MKVSSPRSKSPFKTCQSFPPDQATREKCRSKLKYSLWSKIESKTYENMVEGRRLYCLLLWWVWLWSTWAATTQMLGFEFLFVDICVVFSHNIQSTGNDRAQYLLCDRSMPCWLRLVVSSLLMVTTHQRCPGQQLVQLHWRAAAYERLIFHHWRLFCYRRWYFSSSLGRIGGVFGNYGISCL